MGVKLGRHKGWVGEFAKYYQKHKGRKFIVCGLGPSIEGFTPPPKVITIGVNDCGPDCPSRDISFMPDYSLVVDKPAGFKKTPGRYEAILKLTSTVFVPHISEAKWLETSLKFVLYPMLHQMRKTKAFGEWRDSNTGLPQIHFRGVGSPFGALSLAGFMGASKVGLIGADKTDHLAFKDRLPKVDRSYKQLADWMGERGVEVVNLSEISAITSLPYQATTEF